MPYFLDGNCVMKGTKENPGGTVKCHPNHAKALKHLRALMVNVPEAKSALAGVQGRFDTVRIERIKNET